MKILLVGNYAPDRQHSMQLYAALLAEGMRARGHAVELLQPPAVLGAQVAMESPLFKWFGYFDKFFLFRNKLRRAAAEADIVHLCDQSNAMYMSALTQKPHVVTCHDILAIRSAMGHFPQNRVSVTGRIFQRMIARGLRRARTILCVSKKTRDDARTFLGIPDARLHVIANALQPGYGPLEEGSRAPLLQAIGAPPATEYFLHVGGNHWYKNRAAVIEIFAELRKLPQYKQARLVMAGAGLTPQLQALAAERGVRSALQEVAADGVGQLRALYSGALATLFPSLEEGFGWPILESQACGSPVAIADRPPMNEVAGGAAILVDPSQFRTAAVTIRDALQDASSLRAAGLKNAARYSTSTMLDEYEALYYQVITRKHAAA